MKIATALFNRLEQRVMQLREQYARLAGKKIYAKFDRTLFPEDYRSFAFYFAQIERTLAQIRGLDERHIEESEFLSDKLLAQCAALIDAIDKNPRPQHKSAVNLKPVLSAREKRRQDIHRLPPRERLSKYYEALQALNEKISRQEDCLQNSENPLQKQRYDEQLNITRRRRQRCLEAIELLEEYLAFKEEREN